MKFFIGFQMVASVALLAFATAASAQQKISPSRPSPIPSERTTPPAKPAATPAATPAAPLPAPDALGTVPRYGPAGPPAGGIATLTRAPTAQQCEVLDVQADSLSFDATRRLIIAKGNVKVACNTDSIQSDYAEVDTTAGQVFARGNIRLEYQGNLWQGQEATYNFKTGQGDFGAFVAQVPPYHLVATAARRLSLNMMELEGIMITTCDPETPDYSIRASSATLENNRYLRAKNVRFQLGPVPFFWIPYMGADIDELANFEFTPGYSSRMGAFLLMAYNYPVNETFTSRTHFDIREKRGIGIGQDVEWKDTKTQNYDGALRLYYASDTHPWHNDKEKAEREKLIDSDRYWLHLNDRHNLTDRDVLLTELNYVSDPWLLHDFFDDEYQRNVQPENRVTLSHRGDGFTAGILLNTRLNDFYGNVDRLPEVFLNVNRRKILETPFYYEGASTLSYLNRVYADGSTKEDYDAFRFDTKHMAYWPTRHFGFLNLMPRAGYRGTYYSKTREIKTYSDVVATNYIRIVTNSAGGVTTNITPGTYTNHITELVDGSAVWRSLPELGAETSFQAFGDLYDGPTGIEEDEDLRHVLEPYANYTLRFEPNIRPDELWQFDSVDSLDKSNEIRLGVRNYLQTRRNTSTHNLIFADIFTTLQLDPDADAGEEVFRLLGFKAETRPFSWLSWDFDGTYDAQTNALDTFSTQLEVRQTDIFTFAMDYRYKLDSRQAVAGDLVIYPEARWSARLYARLDLEESNLEEHSYYLIHRTRCLGMGLGVRIRPEHGDDGDDDYTIWFRIWPLAIPQFFSGIGG